jgi:phosphoglycolate phosphatase-like HAD superfamily hydrolase
MSFANTLIPLFDIDWTLLVGKNQAHVDAFINMFTTVFNEPTAAISDIVPHGMIDSQIIVEVMKFHGWQEPDIKQKLPEAFDAINTYYAEHTDPKYVEKLPGVDDLLAELKNHDVMMGLLTGNIEKMAWNKMQMAGIKDYFIFGAFGDMAEVRPQLVSVAQKKIKEKFGINIPANQFVIIGDSPLDVVTAKTAGTKSIAVATGSSDKARLEQEQPELVVNNLLELDKIVEYICK